MIKFYITDRKFTFAWNNKAWKINSFLFYYSNEKSYAWNE